MISRKYLGLTTVLALALTGCSAAAQQNLEPTQASALLYPESESITSPLDKYSASLDELNLIERASNVKIQECMSQAGQPIDLIGTFKDRTSSVERPYGIWNAVTAEKFGYGHEDEDLGIPDLEGKTTEFNRQWDTCLKNIIPSSQYGSDHNSISTRLGGEARMAAQKDSRSSALIEEWKSCLKDKGGTFDGSDPWSPVESLGDKETAIRVAVSDVSCKESMSFVQRMADIEASYQATLVIKNEAALLAQRQKVDETLKEATQIVASFSGS